MNNVHLP